MVVVVTSLIAWLIPDVPTPLKEQIRREAYITSEIVLRTELNRARGEDVIVNSQNGSGDGSGYNSARYSPHNSEDMDREIRHRQKADDRGDEKSYV